MVPFFQLAQEILVGCYQASNNWLTTGEGDDTPDEAELRPRGSSSPKGLRLFSHRTGPIHRGDPRTSPGCGRSRGPFRLIVDPPRRRTRTRFSHMHRRSRRSCSSRQGKTAMTYFHPQEEFQFQALYDYDEEHPGTRYLVEFPDGESYICRYCTDYESENSGRTGHRN